MIPLLEVKVRFQSKERFHRNAYINCVLLYSYECHYVIEQYYSTLQSAQENETEVKTKDITLSRYKTEINKKLRVNQWDKCT